LWCAAQKCTHVLNAVCFPLLFRVFSLHEKGKGEKCGLISVSAHTHTKRRTGHAKQDQEVVLTKRIIVGSKYFFC
jgi:hypothetical protein